MSEPSYFKGACQHCHGHIEFPSAARGTRTTCPHCGQSTELRDPAQAPSFKAACGSCGGRIEFPADAAGSVVDCPHCGIQTKLAAPAETVQGGLRPRKPGRLAGTLAAAAVVVIGIVLTWGKLGRGNGEEVELRGYKFEPANGQESACVVGKIVNHSKVRFFSVKVECELLDQAGKSVGDAGDYLAILEAKDSWEFKAVVSQPEAVAVKLVKITKEK
jgi:predicted RNA-binding Zn-ribbon protein involved in translation (DUF1610 family)